MLSSGHGYHPHELTAVVAQQELHKVPHENMHTSLCVCVCVCTYMHTLVWKCTDTHVRTRAGGRRQCKEFYSHCPLYISKWSLIESGAHQFKPDWLGTLGTHLSGPFLHWGYTWDYTCPSHGCQGSELYQGHDTGAAITSLKDPSTWSPKCLQQGLYPFPAPAPGVCKAGTVSLISYFMG